MKISSSLDVAGENYSRSDLLVNVYGSTEVPNRSIDVDAGHKTRVGNTTLYKIKILKTNIKILTSTSLDAREKLLKI